MAQGINFLKPKPVGDFGFYYRVRLLRIGSFLLLIVCCLALAAALAFSINISQTKKALATQTQIKKEKIEGLKKVESLQTILKQRLSSLVEFKKKDTISYAKVMDEVLKTALSGVTITDIAIDEKNLVVIEGKAPDSSILGAFLDKLSSQDSLFAPATLSSLVRQENGSYLFTVNLKIDDHD